MTPITALFRAPEPVCIRQPEPDETPLSDDEQWVAIREGWHAASVAIFDHHTSTLSVRTVRVADLVPARAFPGAQ